MNKQATEAVESIKATYTTAEVCKILKVSQRTLYNYLKTEQIRATKVGRDWRFTEESLQDFLNTGTTSDYIDRLNAISSKSK